MLLLYNKVRNLNYVESGDQREKLLYSAKIAEPHKKKKKKKNSYFLLAMAQPMKNLDFLK